MSSELELAFERVQEIAWDCCGRVEFDEKIHQHFSEYVTLASKVVARLNIESHLYNRMGGLFAFVGMLYRDTYEIPKHMEEWISEGMYGRYNYRGGVYAAQAVHCYLLWYVLSTEDKEKVVGDLCEGNPYEEIIRFFESGGSFTSEHGMLDKVYPLA
ncbi:hypothetical protein [Hahella sp. NBU794]|uniref:hypothetical protein n=1 Tax=Hahella sp. NBU794 TaxID=3422590 RepID=UPI003D6DA90E